MVRGPVPKPEGQRARRNTPTIPTTHLPASGRQGPAPKLPAGKSLAKAGKAWWKWAWSTPQAASWDDGALYFVFRRAELEDDAELLEGLDGGGLDVRALCTTASADHNEALKELNWIIRRLQALAGGKVSLFREMRELDNRLGLNPKGLVDLRWTIGPDAPAVDGEGGVVEDDVTRRRREREEKRQRAAGS